MSARIAMYVTAAICTLPLSCARRPAPCDLPSVDTAALKPDDARPRRAEFLEELPSAVSQPNWGYRGSARLWCIAADLDRWCAALLGGRVVSQASVERIFQRSVTHSGGGGYAYGWLWSADADGSVRWVSRGSEDYGPNAAAVVRRDQDLRIVVVRSGETGDGVP